MGIAHTRGIRSEFCFDNWVHKWYFCIQGEKYYIPNFYTHNGDEMIWLGEYHFRSYVNELLNILGRNQELIEKIEKYHGKKFCFVALEFLVGDHTDQLADYKIRRSYSADTLKQNFKWLEGEFKLRNMWTELPRQEREWEYVSGFLLGRLK